MIVYMKWVFSGFFIFCGHAILFFMLLTFLIDGFETLMRNLTIWLRGYPRRTVADEIIHKAKLKMMKEKIYEEDGNECRVNG